MSSSSSTPTKFKAGENSALSIPMALPPISTAQPLRLPSLYDKTFHRGLFMRASPVALTVILRILQFM